MAVSTPTYAFVGPGQVRFSYLSDVPNATYYLWVNGVFFTETLETSYVVAIPVGGQIQFDVFDDPDAVAPTYFPGQLTFRWQGRDGVATYRMEQYVDGAWTLRTVLPFRVSNLYHYVTPVLVDGASYQYRAVPVDAEGRYGTALTFAVTMVRYPDAPSSDFDFSAGELVFN